MRHSPDPRGHVLSAPLIALTSALLLGSAALAGRVALRHMELGGGICGDAAGPAHCAWCIATVALALAGLGGLAFSARRALVPVPAR